MDRIFTDFTNVQLIGSRIFLRHDFLSYLFHNNRIIEGVRGGLILGNSHDAGGVPVIQETLPNQYEILFEFEGFEYLMNPLLTSVEMETVQAINAQFPTQPIQEYNPSSDISILDARNQCVILMGKGAQFIVNKNATKQNLKFLDDLNKRIWNERAGK